MPNILKDKVAVVTGAGNGIAKQIALLMGKEGAKVVANDLGCDVNGRGSSKDPADATVAEIKRAGGTAVASYEDVSQFDAGERIIKQAVDTYGKLDILVAVAGILRDRMVFNMSEEDWDAVIATHLKGTFNVVRPTSIIMRQQRSGRIITFTSGSGLNGNPGQANYGAAKAGIAGLTRVVARDLGKYGVTVNCISPGANTRMIAAIPQGPRPQGLQVTDAAAQFPGPEHIAPMVCFLASDAAANVNGQIFSVMGPRISLLSHPRPIKTMFKPGRWTVEELREFVPKTIAAELKKAAETAPQVPAQ
ncbi:MAG: SDR family oxidoreductase [Chloroflexi bacterium]|nr:SDR family oxidoreductase [Chloroflexota bacterium]